MGDNDNKKSVINIPLEVLDKFLIMSKENNDAYASMVSALDTMSNNTAEFADRLDSLEETIKKEKLAEVVQDYSEIITENVKSMHKMVNSFGDPRYSLIAGISNNLKYNNKESRDIAVAAIWILGIVTFIRRNTIKFAFFAGVGIVLVLGSSGITAWDIIKSILH